MEGTLNKHEELIKKMTFEVIEEIRRDIQNQIIGVAQETRDINIILEGKNHRKSFEHSLKPGKVKLETIEQLKKSKIVQLKELERHESILKRSSVMISSNVSRSVGKLGVSRFTEDQIKKIKEIKKKQKEFQQNLKQKQKILEGWLEEKRFQDQELRKRELQEKCQNRKKEIKAQRKEIQKKKKERQLQYQIEVQKLKKIKEKKTLHQKMVQRSNVFRETDMADKLKEYENQKEWKKLAYVNIDTHERQYLQRKRQKDEKRQKQLEENLSHSKTQQFPLITSKFYNKVIKEEEQRQRISRYRKFQKENNISKRRLYSKDIRELFLPKLGDRTNKLVIKEDHKAKQPLTFKEQHQKGNQYMKSAHINITSLQKENEKKTLELSNDSGGNSVFYKNYLNDIRGSSENKSPEKINTATLKGVLEDPNQSEQKKLKKALKLLEQKDRQYPKGNGSAELIDSVKSKMLILNQMIR